MICYLIFYICMFQNEEKSPLKERPLIMDTSFFLTKEKQNLFSFKFSWSPTIRHICVKTKNEKSSRIRSLDNILYTRPILTYILSIIYNTEERLQLQTYSYSRAFHSPSALCIFYWNWKKLRYISENWFFFFAYRIFSLEYLP